MTRIFGIIFLLVGIFSVLAQSIRFDLKSGNTKCIAENIKTGTLTVGKYNVINPNEDQPIPDTYKISARVTSVGGIIYHKSDIVESGEFGFTGKEYGDYITCFWFPDYNPSEPPVTVTINFDWRSGVAAKKWRVVSKGQIDFVEVQLKNLEDTITSVHDEMFYLREREEEMMELNQATNTRMACLSFCSLFISLSVAGLQPWHLKTFFERKKLL